jgi:ELWxxDGT repeat protein
LAQPPSIVFSDSSSDTFSSFSFNYFELNGKNYFFNNSYRKSSSGWAEIPFSNSLWQIDSSLNDAYKIASLPHVFSQQVKFKGKLVFFCNEENLGLNSLNAIWSTDGTSSGTSKLSNFTGYLIGDAVATSNEIFFVVGNQIFENNQNSWIYSLYKSNGTEGNLTLLRNFNEPPGFMYAFNDRILFAADNDLNGYELWISDGSIVGTYQLKDINSGTGGSFDLYNGQNTFTEMNGIIYFVGHDGLSRELWRTDGTDIGTYKVKMIGMPYYDGLSYNMPKFTIMNNHIYFTGRSLFKGLELWKSDGTEEGTMMVKDIEEGSNSSAPRNIISNGNKLYFFTDWYTKLWISDGTDENTFLIKEFNILNSDVNPKPFFANDFLYFFSSLENGNIGIWKSDGTSVNTIDLPNIEFDLSDAYSNYSFIILGDKMFHTKDNSIIGKEPNVFYSDSLRLIKDITKPGADAFSFYSFKDKLYFQTIKDSLFLWQTDGNSQSINLFKGFKANTPVFFLDSINSELFFIISTFDNQYGLWKTDGTEFGTTFIKNIELYYNRDRKFHDRIRNYFIFNGILNNDFVTYKSDGTEAGTIPIINKKTQFKEVGNYVYFLSDSSLIRSHDLINFSVLENSFFADEIFEAGGILYFIKDKNQLWTYQNGTKIHLKTFDTNSQISSLTSFQNKLLFSASSGGTESFGNKNYEIWYSNGTQIGTGLLKEINPELHVGSNPSFLKAINGKLYFVADDGEYGKEIWISDGTTVGTTIIKDVNPGLTGSMNNINPNFTFFEGEIYFTAQTDQHGLELWKTDGTSDATSIVVDLYPGKNSSNPQNLMVSNNLLFFNASNQNSGNNLWKYNPDCKYLINMGSPLRDLDNSSIDIQTKSNIGKINASIKITNQSKVNFLAPSIELNPGFYVEKGTVFKASQGGCN